MTWCDRGKSRVKSDGRHPQSPRLIYLPLDAYAPEETQRRLTHSKRTLSHGLCVCVGVCISLVSADARTQLHLIANNNDINYVHVYCIHYNLSHCVLRLINNLFFLRRSSTLHRKFIAIVSLPTFNVYTEFKLSRYDKKIWEPTWLHHVSDCIVV